MTGPRNSQIDFDIAALFTALDAMMLTVSPTWSLFVDSLRYSHKAGVLRILVVQL